MFLPFKKNASIANIDSCVETITIPHLFQCMFIHWMPIDPMDKHRFILLLLDVHPPSSSGIDSVFIQCQEMATALLHGFPFTLQHHDMSLFLEINVPIWYTIYPRCPQTWLENPRFMDHLHPGSARQKENRQSTLVHVCSSMLRQKTQGKSRKMWET